MLNLSLSYAVHGMPGNVAERVYAHLCNLVSRALAPLGIDANPRAVEGSFCDGRFNLAVGERKIAGTAQYWRRRGGRQAVLAHALLLVDADVVALTDRANAFEAALGSERRYRADVLTTIATECRSIPCDLPSQLHRHVEEALVTESPRRP